MSMQKSLKILIIDDDAITRNSFVDWFSAAGYEVVSADNAEKALESVITDHPLVAIAGLASSEALQFIKKARQISPEIKVILLTRQGDVPTAVTATRDGALECFEKPVLPERVEALISRLPESQRVKAPKEGEEKYTAESIVAVSQRMQKSVEMIKLVARSNAPVLISGESGTGKEMAARIIHALSFRKDSPFTAVSCAHLPEQQIECELFGQENGGYGGSHIIRKGKMETANRGTLFLDEIGDLDPNVQVHLLRAFEEKTFMRVGGDMPVQSDVRLISATNKDLRKAIESGNFREDLYYRLSVVNIELPPLRNRKEDIPVLAETFLKRFNRDNQKEIAGFSPEADDFLLKYEWPGNIRELENAIERAVILASGKYIEVEDLSQQNLYLPHKTPGGKTMREIEKTHIINVLIEAGGNCSEAARLLGISRMTLYNKIKAYGLNINKIGGGG